MHRLAGLFGILVSVLIAGTQAASAQTMAEAVGLLNDGDYIRAAEVASEIGSSDGFALAAQALAIHGYEFAPEAEKQDFFDRAMAYAERAIALDPDNSEAHLRSAHAMGRYAQTIGVLEALNEGYAERIKAALDRAIALDPEKPDAYISLGAWHAEIVKSAGFMAGILYNASEEDALAAYDRALALGRGLNHVHLEYAYGLGKLDEGENKALMIEHAEKALALPAENAYARMIRDKAGALLERLRTE